MNIIERVAEKAETCARCRDLGLPDGGIAQGDWYIEMSNGTQFENCCEDCFARLREECTGNDF